MLFLEFHVSSTVLSNHLELFHIILSLHITIYVCMWINILYNFTTTLYSLWAAVHDMIFNDPHSHLILIFMWHVGPYFISSGPINVLIHVIKMLIIWKMLNIVSDNTHVNIADIYQIDQRIKEGDMLCSGIKLLFKNESWVVDLSDWGGLEAF